MTVEALERTKYYYYQDQDIQQATRGLEFLLQSKDLQIESEVFTLYLFGRIAILSPKALESFKQMTGNTPVSKKFLEYVLKGPGNPNFPRPLEMAITHPGNLDLLWAEFFVTGDITALQHLVAVLDWEDQVRNKLEKWLKEDQLQTIDGQKRKAFEVLLHSCMFPIDFVNRIIDRSLDLDLHTALNVRAGKLKFDQLPIKLSYEELMRLSMKSAVIWSFRSNALKHEIIARFCKMEAARKGGAGRVLLAQSNIPS